MVKKHTKIKSIKKANEEYVLFQIDNVSGSGPKGTYFEVVIYRTLKDGRIRKVSKFYRKLKSALNNFDSMTTINWQKIKV
jgi:hypothetical protein